MISALANTATSSASSAAPQRSREQESVSHTADAAAPEASAVVTLSVAGTTLAAQPSSAAAAKTSSGPTLVPNLIYAPADTNEDGVISPGEEKAYELEQFPEGMESRSAGYARASESLKEYTSVAQSGQ